MSVVVRSKASSEIGFKSLSKLIVPLFGVKLRIKDTASACFRGMSFHQKLVQSLLANKLFLERHVATEISQTDI